jgi:sterol desaturase/sphingolipid hydroxylase (fatty acid hydroxylase superfamily)
MLAISLQPAWDWLLLTLGKEFFENPFHFSLPLLAVVALTGIGYSSLDWAYKKLPLKDIVYDGTKTLGGYAIIAFGSLKLHYSFRPIVVEVPSQAPSLEAVVLQVAVFMVLGEVLTYWWHRLEHTSKFIFRNVHYLHHSGRQPLTVWTNYVVHPVEGLAVLICFYSALFMYGAHPLTFMIFTVTSVTPMIVTHSGYNPSFYPTWVFPSPAAHDLHHAEPFPGVNFSVIMSFGDRLFGTYKPPSARTPPRLKHM